MLNYVYSLCVFYYNVLSCMADVADCPLQRLSAIVIKRHYAFITDPVLFVFPCVMCVDTVCTG